MILCFDIGGSRIRAALADQRGMTHLGEVATPTDDLTDFLDALRGFATQRPAAVAVSIPGLLGTNSKIANIPCLNGRNVQAVMDAAFGCKVTILNDADAFALAEANQGAGRGYARVFAIILGSGIGGGVVMDGKVVAGAGEWGHGPILRDPALICGCGQRGCLETLGSARGMERLHGGTVRAEDIVADWVATGNLDVVPRWLDVVAGPLAMAVNLLNAQIVPVGGGLGNSPELIAALDLAVRARILRATTNPLVVCAQISVDAGLLGAAIAARSA